MIYCDTSLLVAVFAGEAGAPVVRAWLSAQTPDSLVISAWTDTEFASAIALKRLIGEFDEPAMHRILAAWRSTRESFHTTMVRHEYFHDAADLIIRPGVNLRAPDALHLAIARANGFRLATLDRGLTEAAQIVGVGVEPITR